MSPLRKDSCAAARDLSGSVVKSLDDVAATGRWNGGHHEGGGADHAQWWDLVFHGCCWMHFG